MSFEIRSGQAITAVPSGTVLILENERKVVGPLLTPMRSDPLRFFADSIQVRGDRIKGIQLITNDVRMVVGPERTLKMLFASKPNGEWEVQLV